MDVIEQGFEDNENPASGSNSFGSQPTLGEVDADVRAWISQWSLHNDPAHSWIIQPHLGQTICPHPLFWWKI